MLAHCLRRWPNINPTVFAGLTQVALAQLPPNVRPLVEDAAVLVSASPQLPDIAKKGQGVGTTMGH